MTEHSLFYTVEVRDKEGRVLQHISAPSRSYVEQWNQLTNIQASQAAKTVRETSGAEHGESASEGSLRANAEIGIVTSGIRVGVGTTAVAIDDYNLETPLGEGTGVDELSHQAVEFTEPSVVGSTCSFTVKRIMVNNSGSTITVKEIGCLVIQYLYAYLGFRDVLGTAVDVPDGGAITVEYTIGATA